jgi:hypothetical protein
VGPRAVLDAVVKRKIPISRRESKPRTQLKKHTLLLSGTANTLTCWNTGGSVSIILYFTEWHRLKPNSILYCIPVPSFEKVQRRETYENNKKEGIIECHSQIPQISVSLY